MNETITVAGFACIKEVSLSLNEFNLLIGPQATGKSIIAKLLFFCKSVVWQAFSAAENLQLKRDFDKDIIKRFKELFPPQSWGPSAFSIDYRYGDFFLKVTRQARADEYLETLSSGLGDV